MILFSGSDLTFAASRKETRRDLASYANVFTYIGKNHPTHGAGALIFLAGDVP
jgi:hypothetical protein